MVEFAVIGQGAVDRPAVDQHGPVGLRAGEQLGPVAGAGQDQVGRAARRQHAGLDAHHARGVARDAARPVGPGMVELEDARALAQHFDEVEIAIGVERVAGVVGGKADIDPARLLPQARAWR